MTVIEPTRPVRARSVALDVLLDCQKRRVYAQELLDRRLAAGELSPADRRLATQLVFGVLRRRATLDALLHCIVARPRQRIEPWLVEVLRLGVFQLALLSQIPSHAAVHETVELAADLGRPRAKSFVNGVMRGVCGLLTEEWTDRPAVDALPAAEGRYRRLARPVLPEPGSNRVEYFAAAFSLPCWLAERWLARYSWEECLRFGFWFAGPPALWLRCNRLRRERADCLDAFTSARIQAAPGEFPESIGVLHGPAVPELPGFPQGWFTVQDQSGMRVVQGLSPEPGSRVLDLCAAPGGKTSHLAEYMENKGEIIACDVDRDRLRLVDESCRRLGITIVKTHWLKKADAPEIPAGPFDAALVDVPCSNTGVLARRPEARWRLKPADLQRLVPQQTKLLLQAAERVRPQGTVVYSTCSIEPEENEQLVHAVAGKVPWLELDAEEKQVPGKPSDGGYWARLRRRA
jgi:16S rRNA (cytosine967-C5)-methyltransferase